eukprot:2566709-Rhodomonas_salina.1
MDFDTQHQRSETPKFAFPAVSKISHLMYEEVLHSSFHCPLELLARMAAKVCGMPCPVRVACATKVNCSHCYEANTVLQDYPTASDSRLTAETELWQWDMLDMGENYATTNGNSYSTIFLVKRTRFLMVFLHASKTGATIAGLIMMSKA